MRRHGQLGLTRLALESGGADAAAVDTQAVQRAVAWARVLALTHGPAEADGTDARHTAAGAVDTDAVTGAVGRAGGRAVLAAVALFNREHVAARHAAPPRSTHALGAAADCWLAHAAPRAIEGARVGTQAILAAEAGEAFAYAVLEASVYYWCSVSY